MPSSGSTSRHAVCAPSLVRISSQASPSFHGRTIVCLSAAAGTPADAATGLGCRRPPEAFTSGATLTSTASCVP